MFNRSWGKRIGLFILVTILCWLMTGCAVMMIGAAISAEANGKKEGEVIIPINNQRYKITYNGENAEEHWAESCQKACSGDCYKIVTQEEIVRPKGLPGWTGTIECGAVASNTSN